MTDRSENEDTRLNSILPELDHVGVGLVGL
jgi:hypothetical protein